MLVVVFEFWVAISLPMLVLRKKYASQLAPPHTPPAGVITTGDSTGKEPTTKSKFKPSQISVVGDNTGRRRLLL